jgi:hypothetical protein
MQTPLPDTYPVIQKKMEVQRYQMFLWTYNIIGTLKLCCSLMDNSADASATHHAEGLNLIKCG